MKDNSNKKHNYIGIIVTIIAGLVMVGFVTFMSAKMLAGEQKDADLKMQRYAQSVTTIVNESLSDDLALLSTYANALSRVPSLADVEAHKIIYNFKKTSRIKELELLLPDNTLVHADNTVDDVSGLLSFEQEASLGLHVNSRDIDFKTGENNVIRVCVPVYHTGQKVAVLCGLIPTDSLSERYPKQLFDEEGAYFYIVDGITGRVVLNGLTDPLDSIFDLSARSIKGGGSLIDLKNSLENGESGFLSFKSNNLGDEHYVYYEPMGINRWSVCVFVPTNQLMAGERSRHSLYMLSLFGGICICLCYTVFMYFFFSKEAKDKQKRLDTVSYIYQVEKLLFSAHEDKSKIPEALKEIKNLTDGDMAFYSLLSLEDNTAEPAFFVDDVANTQMVKRFLKSNDFFKEEFSHSDQAVCKTDYVVIPIEDVDNVQIGVLGVSNVSNPWQAYYILRQVAVSFSMLSMNIHTYDMIKEMGEVDVLTGVMNRNCFESRQREYSQRCRDSVCCVYVDVNGLHELNNEQGHEAGDNMLRYVANSISNHFGRNDTYRMGGDEFVAVVMDSYEDEVQEHLAQIEREMDKKHYHIAVGMAYGTVPVDMVWLSKRAEILMFEAKSKYYSDLGNDRRRR